MISTKDKIKAAQVAVGSFPDALPGNSTWDAFYRFLEHEGYLTIDWPYECHQWSCYVAWTKPERLTLISGEDQNISVSDFAYSVSGSFTAPSGVKPCSFLVNDGNIIWGRACHANTWDGEKPESVLSWSYEGYNGLSLCRVATDLPEGVKTAIGGLRLVEGGKPVPRSFNEEEEGFTGRFSDVFRTTQHCGIGVDKYGNVGVALHKWCSLADFQRRMINIGFVDAISIDGGSVVAMNLGDFKYRTNQKQGYMIQL